MVIMRMPAASKVGIRTSLERMDSNMNLILVQSAQAWCGPGKMKDKGGFEMPAYVIFDVEIRDGCNYN